MKSVYLLRSLTHPDQHYVGVTSEVRERLKAHNAGQSVHTAKYRPWELTAYIAFRDDRRAIEFEK